MQPAYKVISSPCKGDGIAFRPVLFCENTGRNSSLIDIQDFVMRLLKASQKILCRYTNPITRIQIIKISNIPNWSFERSVMPHGSILFEAYQDARLEIHTSEMMSAILSDVIPCSQLVKSTETIRKRPQRAQQTA